jgi:hypothetical protein
MKLKYSAFLVSLALVVGLIGLLPMLLTIDGSASAMGTWVGLFPGFALGLILATCSGEEQAGSRGLLFVPMAAILGMLMAILCWLFASIIGEHRLGIYALVNMLGVYAFFALIRQIYDTKTEYRKAHAIAFFAATPALLLLAVPLSPSVHGIIAALWVGFLGIGLAKLSGRRKRGVRRLRD